MKQTKRGGGGGHEWKWTAEKAPASVTNYDDVKRANGAVWHTFGVGYNALMCVYILQLYLYIITHHTTIVCIFSIVFLSFQLQFQNVHRISHREILPPLDSRQ